MNEAPPPREHDQGQAVHLRDGIFLFRDAVAETVEGTLKTLGFLARPYALAAPSSFWVYPAAGEPILQLHPIRSIPDFEIDLVAGTYQRWWLPLKAALGGDPASALRIALSEGEMATYAIAHIAVLMLTRHPGIVQDDNTAHAWTLAEIVAETVVDGCRFFQPSGLAGG